MSGRTSRTEFELSPPPFNSLTSFPLTTTAELNSKNSHPAAGNQKKKTKKIHKINLAATYLYVASFIGVSQMDKVQSTLLKKGRNENTRIIIIFGERAQQNSPAKHKLNIIIIIYSRRRKEEVRNKTEALPGGLKNQNRAWDGDSPTLFNFHSLTFVYFSRNLFFWSFHSKWVFSAFSFV